jgi:tRNA dimethylallyltransferase
MKNTSNKPKLLVILGPTAIGKSDLAVELALIFNGEIISADSRQVYKGLDVGTGKITKEEMRGVPHSLINVVSPDKQFTVTDWKKEALEEIEGIVQRKHTPIVCGGTGLYIQSVVDNTVFPEVLPNKVLRQELGEKTVEELCSFLNSLDPERFKTIDHNNPRRLIRAIEIATELGSVPTLKAEPLFDTLHIGLTLPRDEINERIHRRLYKRMEEGLVEEAERLHKNGLSYERMIELGLEYRYLARYLRHEMTRDEMLEKLETEIRRYAKRQETWFKRDERIRWFSPNQKNEIFEVVRGFFEE